MKSVTTGRVKHFKMSPNLYPVNKLLIPITYKLGSLTQCLLVSRFMISFFKIRCKQCFLQQFWFVQWPKEPTNLNILLWGDFPQTLVFGAPISTTFEEKSSIPHLCSRAKLNGYLNLICEFLAYLVLYLQELNFGRIRCYLNGDSKFLKFGRADNTGLINY